MPHETKHTQKGGEGSWCDWNELAGAMRGNVDAMTLPDMAGRARRFTQAA